MLEESNLRKKCYWYKQFSRNFTPSSAEKRSYTQNTAIYNELSDFLFIFESIPKVYGLQHDISNITKWHHSFILLT